jgi:hypothetical protein
VGHGFATASGKTGAAVGLLLSPFMKGSIGLPSTLLIIATGCLVAGGVTFLLRRFAEPPIEAAAGAPG